MTEGSLSSPRSEPSSSTIQLTPDYSVDSFESFFESVDQSLSKRWGLDWRLGKEAFRLTFLILRYEVQLFGTSQFLPVILHVITAFVITCFMFGFTEYLYCHGRWFCVAVHLWRWLKFLPGKGERTIAVTSHRTLYTFLTIGCPFVTALAIHAQCHGNQSTHQWGAAVMKVTHVTFLLSLLLVHCKPFHFVIH
jgi:hypothetical protein